MPTLRLPARALWLLLVPLLALAALGVARHRGARRSSALRAADYEPAAPTPGSPAVDGLRQAVSGANVVICVIDAARADHLGCYGYPRETTPNIDRLADEGVLFAQHFCQYPETKISTACLFTSQHPDTHLAYGDRGLMEGTFIFPEGLRAAGFHTVMFSQNGYASPMWGLGQGFEEAYYEPHLKQAGRDVPDIWRPEALLELISEWLEGRPRTPFFAYVHFMPPHDPYLAPDGMKHMFLGQQPPNAWQGPYPFDEVEPGLRRRSRAWPERQHRAVVNLYDGHLRYADWAVGELARLLRARGLFGTTLFIVTADHGEAFGEHGYRGHTFSAYDECIHIPLVIRFPGDAVPPRRVDGLTQTVDLLPTVFDLLGIPYPKAGVQGRSALPLIAGQAEELNPYVLARTGGDPPSYIIRDRSSMMLLYRGGRLRALYDLAADPRQMSNIIEQDPEEAERLVGAFREFAAAQTAPPRHFLDPEAEAPEPPAAPRIEVTEEMRAALRALGYLR